MQIVVVIRVPLEPECHLVLEVNEHGAAVHVAQGRQAWQESLGQGQTDRALWHGQFTNQQVNRVFGPVFRGPDERRDRVCGENRPDVREGRNGSQGSSGACWLLGAGAPGLLSSFWSSERPLMPTGRSRGAWWTSRTTGIRCLGLGCLHESSTREKAPHEGGTSQPLRP